MRVLMTGDTAGGVFTYVCELSSALAQREVETTLALMGPRLTSAQRSALRRCGAEQAFAQDVALEWMDDPWRDVERAGRWLLELEEHVRPDVVHLNGYAHGALAWSAPTLVVGHSCVLSWYEAVRGHPAPPRWGRYRREVEDGLRAVTFVAAPTAAMLSELIRLYGLRGPFTVIPNGRREPATAPPKEPFVLAAGRLWDEAKNLGALDRAAAGLDWPVVVAGAGAAQRPEHTHLLGQLPEQKLLEWMGRASIFAAPARYEPFGLAALEAGLAGCALVLGDIPSLREVWGDAALYVNPLDDEELALTLARLIDDEDLCGSRGAAARAHARRYSPERMAAGYLDVYEQLATEATAEPEGFVALR